MSIFGMGAFASPRQTPFPGTLSVPIDNENEIMFSFCRGRHGVKSHSLSLECPDTVSFVWMLYLFQLPIESPAALQFNRNAVRRVLRSPGTSSIEWN
jgi:hypothetical protein